MKLKVQNIYKSYKKTKVLEDVSFDVDSGKVTGLLGQNGAGKTSLLRIIGGVLPFESGSIDLDGKKLDNKDIGLLLGGDVGLYIHMTARENIRYFADLHSVDRAVTEERIKNLADIFFITDFLDKKVCELSRGTKQKISILRAVIHDPDVILFDEPETGLDFEAAKTISNFLSKVANEGKIVIYSSHSIGNILATCHDSIILHKGHVVSSCNISDIQKNNTSFDAHNIIYSLVCRDEEKRSVYEK